MQQPRGSATLATVLLYAAGLILAVGCAWALVVPMRDDFAGPWYENAYRMAFIHIPLAWTGALAFIVAAVQAARYLIARDSRLDSSAYGAAEAGLVLTILATVTGMIFSKTQWGAYWNWDPRQTSIFFVLLIYAAYLLLRQALPDDEALRGRLSAAYLLLAVAPMIWLVAIFPRMGVVAQASMHPERAPFDGIHWAVMFVNFAGLIGVLGVLMRLHGVLGQVRAAARERWL